MGAATTAAPEAAPDATPSHDGAAEATRTTQELFEWSGYVHLGTGAEDCPGRLDGSCTEPTRPGPDGGVLGHFHAWVCLPNPYQIRDIQDKARAAKARKARALRDPESDSHAILEGELDELRRKSYDNLLEMWSHRRVDDEIGDIIEEVQDDERFENQAIDAEEFQRLNALDPEDRDAEEFERLQAQMLAYAAKMQEIIDHRRERALMTLKGLPVDKVIDDERELRIENITTEVFMHTYYTWVIYSCVRVPTLDGFPTVRKFATPEAQKSAPPEVVRELRAKISRLENRTRAEGRGDAAGNS